MSDTDVLPAPDLSALHLRTGKWEREQEAFLRLKSTLPAELKGKYVAVHEGKVVDAGENQIEVALRCYKKHGYVPIYVGLVSDLPLQPVQIPSPRIVFGES
jgi:hypothetical protein